MCLCYGNPLYSDHGDDLNASRLAGLALKASPKQASKLVLIDRLMDRYSHTGQVATFSQKNRARIPDTEKTNEPSPAFYRAVTK